MRKGQKVKRDPSQGAFRREPGTIIPKRGEKKAGGGEILVHTGTVQLTIFRAFGTKDGLEDRERTLLGKPHKKESQGKRKETICRFEWEADVRREGHQCG